MQPYLQTYNTIHTRCIYFKHITWYLIRRVIIKFIMIGKSALYLVKPAMQYMRYPVIWQTKWPPWISLIQKLQQFSEMLPISWSCEVTWFINVQLLTVSRHVHSNNVGVAAGSCDAVLCIMVFGRCLSIAMVTITSRRINDSFDISAKLNGRGVFTILKS